MDYGDDEDYMFLMEQAFEAWDKWNYIWPDRSGMRLAS